MLFLPFFFLESKLFEVFKFVIVTFEWLPLD